MSNTLSSNEQAASGLAATIQTSLEQYLGFNLSVLSVDVPVAGSGMPDALAPEVTRALRAWRNLIDSDAKAIEAAASELASFDDFLAQQLMGVGGGQS